MYYKKKLEVAMIAHNNINTNLVLYLDENCKPIELSQNNDKFQYHTNQHLYFLSDAKINDGDWYVNQDNVVYRFLTGKGNVKRYPDGFFTHCRKIEASTDLSLLINKVDGYTHNRPVNISSSFIEYYIKEYNKGNVVKEVTVEWIFEPSRTYGITGDYTTREINKAHIDSNDTIVVCPIIETWLDIEEKFSSCNDTNYKDFFNWLQANYEVPKQFILSTKS